MVGMRTLTLAALLLAAGCRFDPGGGGGTSGEVDAPGAPVDADPNRPDADPGAPDAEPEPPDAAAAPDAEVPDAEPPVAVCPAGYDASGDPGLASHYRYVPSPQRDWLEAAADCADDLVPYTHLVIIETEAEAVAVDGLSSNRDIWVGATDAVDEGDWRDLFGEAVEVDLWDDGEPDNGGDPSAVPGEDCAEQRDGGGWRDVDCAQSRRFVCECDLTRAP